MTVNVLHLDLIVIVINNHIVDFHVVRPRTPLMKTNLDISIIANCMPYSIYVQTLFKIFLSNFSFPSYKLVSVHEFNIDHISIDWW